VRVGAAEPKIPVGQFTVEQSQDKPQLNRTFVRWAVVDRVIAELPGPNQRGDNSAEVVLGTTLLEPDSEVLMMKGLCFGPLAFEELFNINQQVGAL